MNSFFNLTRNERKGVFVFSAFLTFLFFVGIYFHSESSSTLYLEKEAIKTPFKDSNSNKSFQKKLYSKKSIIKSKFSAPRENFNPNELSKNDWINMGFSDKQANVFVNYISKKGGLKNADDILKIYGVPLSQLEALKSKITIPIHLIKLNEINQEQLEALKGIGEVLSIRIIKYREKLGGFYSIDQLKEVYGVKPEVITEIKNKVTVDSKNIKTIAINSISYQDLKSNPYLKANEVKKIIELRSEVPIQDFNQLFSVISDSTRVLHLKNYLKYD